ncbi:uncharacterized protein LOC110012809 [Sesamum indicum]|uniref:Uncharacterized protein LOC110012809 n=1 Tax=Sesamum indicum TaxID=4182 RepID=A0A8M8VAK2_SESIN|nr:uncharacterized protein LOC110012809 [Sesamum indicum]
MNEQTQDNPVLIATIVLDENHNRIYEDPQKTQKFYQDNFVSTRSIFIQNMSPKGAPANSSQIDYRRIFINSILSLCDWRKSPYNFKNIPNKKYPLISYWDYIKAFQHFLLKQNEKNTMSFYFLFDIKISPEKISNLFVRWWYYFGPEPQILPKSIQEAFKFFTKNLKISMFPGQHLPNLLKCCIQFNLTWILKIESQFKPIQIDENTVIFSLGKKYCVKWWDKMNTKIFEQTTILEWFKQNPTMCETSKILGKEINSEQEQFLLRKNNLSARIAKATTTEEMQKILEEVQSDKEDSPSPIHLGNENEDDCFGIFSPIP